MTYPLIAQISISAILFLIALIFRFFPPAEINIFGEDYDKNLKNPDLREQAAKYFSKIFFNGVLVYVLIQIALHFLIQNPVFGVLVSIALIHPILAISISFTSNYIEYLLKKL